MPDVQLLVLGKIIADGMARVDAANRWTGTGSIQNTYHTWFPMPDGRTWELTLTLRDEHA